MLQPPWGWDVAKSIQISLDNIISAATFYIGEWTPNDKLKSNAAFDTLRFLLIRLYEAGKGRPLDVNVQLSIGTVASTLGLSRYWTGVLVARLADAGWLETHSSWTDERMKSSTIFRAGRMLKRLMFHLIGARRKQKRHSSDDKYGCQFLRLLSPIEEKKKEHAFQEQAEQPLPEQIQLKFPLLRRWMERGAV